MDEASSGGKKRKSRGRGLRTTTGCLTCRQRHLKCDGRTPACGLCEKSGRSCISALANAAAGQDSASTSLRARPISVESPNRSQQQTDAHHAARWQLAAELTCHSQAIDPGLGSRNPGGSDLDRTEAASGLLHLNFGSPSVSSGQDALYPHASSVDYGEGAINALTPPDAALSRWFSPLTGDAAVPVGDLPLGIEDTGQKQGSPSLQHVNGSSHGQRNPALTSKRDIYSVQRSSDVRLDSGLRNPSQNHVSQRQPWHGSQPSKPSSDEQKLFENYVKETSTWIDLFDPRGHFSSFVPHLAMDDAGLMNAILALSARSLLLTSDTPDEQRDPNISIRYYNETLQYLQKAMHYDTYTVSCELLATALIVSTYEMLGEFDTGWERHLQGVFWIQRSQLIHGESEGFKQAVWWAWLRQDVWAAFRERRKTFSYWKPTRTYAEMSADEIALRSIWLFARAVDYCSKEEVKAGGADLTKRIKNAERILSMLDEWQSSLTINFRPLPCSENAHDAVFERIWIHPPAYAVSIQLHHAARILLLLESPSQGGMQGFIKQQRRLEKSVETICGIAMALTDKASSMMSSQCLFVAGLCTQDSRKRAAILELIDQCQVLAGWPTKYLSKELRAEWEKLDAR